jgi:hypothetical protein
MTRFILMMAAAGFLAAGAAHAQTMTAGFYSSTGTVASNNGNSNCAAVGLVPGAANNSVLNFPGDGNPGLTIYVPLSGTEELCNGFPNVPAGGLNGFNASSDCVIYTAGGAIPTPNVQFQFTSIGVDNYSAIGTTTVTIPANAPIGGGCSATVETTTVYSGN